MFRSSPPYKKRSNQPFNISCFVSNTSSPPFIPHNPGFELFSPTLTRRASKLLPKSNDPTRFSIPHTAAPPAVARYNRVAILKGLFVKWWSGSWLWLWLWWGVLAGSKDWEEWDGHGHWCFFLPVNERALAPMLAFWMAFNIEGEYPPETSVPNPT